MPRRVVVLALDGVEYDLVVKWKLRGLMQKHYGRHQVVKSPRYGKAHTPSSWVSFITGLPPEEHGVDDWWSWGRVLDWLRTRPPLSWVKGKRLLLKRLGINVKPRMTGRDMVRAETIFDLVKPSVALNVPGWNEPPEPRLEYGEAVRSGGVKALLAKVWVWHERRKRQLFEWLARPGEWRLLMAWFDLADLAGHACMVKCRPALWRAYLELDRLARQVAARIPPGTALLVASDHGMKPMPDGTGDHSDHGFWSLNTDPPLQPRSILDFKDLIVKLAGGEK